MTANHVARAFVPRRVTRRRRLVAAVLGGVFAACLLGAGAAFAYWTFTDSSNGHTAQAVADVLPQGATPGTPTTTPNPNSSTVSVSFVQASTTAGVPIPASQYTLKRYPAAGGSSVAISASCSGTGTITCTESNVPDGKWQYTDTPTWPAISNWVGTESANSGSVTVDTTPPTVSVTYPANNGNYNSSGWTSGGSTPCGAIATICGQATDATSGISGTSSISLTITESSNGYTWNGSAFQSGSHTFNPTSYTSSTGLWTYGFTSSNFPADGTYSVAVTATDRAGNMWAASSNSFTFDSTAPNAPVITYPAASTVYSSGGTHVWSGNITGTASDNTGGSGVASTQVEIQATSGVNNTKYWNGGNSTWQSTAVFNAASGTGSWTYAFALPADGGYTVTAKSTDNAGNTGTTSSVTTTFDSTAPNAPVITYPAASTVYSSGGTHVWSGNITGTASDNTGGSGVASTQVEIQATSGVNNTKYWNGGNSTWQSTAVFNAASGTGSWTYAFALPADGGYTVTAKSTDNAGNTGTTSSVTTTFDSTAPVNNLTLSGQTGGGSFLSGTTVYYQGSIAGSLTITNALSDSGSGPASSAFPALGGTATGWTHTGGTVTTPTGGPYVSSTFSWSAGTTSGPIEVVTGTDNAGNTNSGTTLTFVKYNTVTFASAGTYGLTVPASTSATTIDFTMLGAGGGSGEQGNSGGGAGGAGGTATGTISVPASATPTNFTVVVGGGGGGGGSGFTAGGAGGAGGAGCAAGGAGGGGGTAAGGGGGGATCIYLQGAPANTIVEIGGGGGGGAYGNASANASGGAGSGGVSGPQTCGTSIGTAGKVGYGTAGGGFGNYGQTVDNASGSLPCTGIVNSLGTGGAAETGSPQAGGNGGNANNAATGSNNASYGGGGNGGSISSGQGAGGGGGGGGQNSGGGGGTGPYQSGAGGGGGGSAYTGGATVNSTNYTVAMSSIGTGTNNGPSGSTGASGGDGSATFTGPGLTVYYMPTVAVSDNLPVQAGSTLTFTATVTGPSGGPTPAGTMGWAITPPGGGSNSCSSTSGPTGSSNVATYTCSISSAVNGTYSATANYPGDSNYSAASGSDTTATVLPVIAYVQSNRAGSSSGAHTQGVVLNNSITAGDTLIAVVDLGTSSSATVTGISGGGVPSTGSGSWTQVAGTGGSSTDGDSEIWYGTVTTTQTGGGTITVTGSTNTAFTMVDVSEWTKIAGVDSSVTCGDTANDGVWSDRQQRERHCRVHHPVGDRRVGHLWSRIHRNKRQHSSNAQRRVLTVLTDCRTGTFFHVGLWRLPHRDQCHERSDLVVVQQGTLFLSRGCLYTLIDRRPVHCRGSNALSDKMDSVSEFLVLDLDSIDERLLDYLDEDQPGDRTARAKAARDRGQISEGASGGGGGTGPKQLRRGRRRRVGICWRDHRQWHQLHRQHEQHRYSNQRWSWWRHWVERWGTVRRALPARA